MPGFDDDKMRRGQQMYDRAQRQFNGGVQRITSSYDILVRLRSSVEKYRSDLPDSTGDEPFNQAHVDAVEALFDQLKADVTALVSGAPDDLPVLDDVDVFAQSEAGV